MITKYDWGAACRFFPGFRDSSGAQRTAWTLMDLYNENVNCAFPTRETLSQQLGSAPEAVSKWVGMLKGGGAVSCVPIHFLSAESQAFIGRSAKRAQVYLLNFAWAYEVLSLRDEYVFDRKQALLHKVIVQSPLPAIGAQVNTSSGNQTVTSVGNCVDTLIPYDQTLDHTLEDIGGSEGPNLGVYTRERAA
ncbi:hypothetical protein NKI48_29730 [Mesorhizobium sp. M0644]|uniref:hypothetical protein n=1 Tax=unclassified Mesorhizobium TaxID=325217 RepID=UPI00333BF6C5